MKYTETPLQGSYLIDLEPRVDERGFFARYFCEHEFLAQGLNTNWVQINTSLSNEAGTLRGLHFQRPPNAEVKMVRCLQGAIWDVIVDLRAGSLTFSKWFGAELTTQNRTMMYVPKGFAHGFISLEPNSEILYLVSASYSPQSEGTLLWSDTNVAIQWPVSPKFISEKDAIAPKLSETAPLSVKL
jgi:dTDP-4-dehydrorhamnose 3,5-epimerase